MKASQFKTSFAEIIKQAVREANKDRCIEIIAIIDSFGVEISTKYRDTAALITIVPFHTCKNSTEVLTKVIKSLTFWAADHECNSAYHVHMKKQAA